MLGYTPVRNSIFLVDLTFSFDLSIATQLTVTSIREEPGFVMGPYLGARMVFFPNQKYHPFGAMGFRNYKIYRMGSIDVSNGAKLSGITKMSGLTLGIGIGIDI